MHAALNAGLSPILCVGETLEQPGGDAALLLLTRLIQIAFAELHLLRAGERVLLAVDALSGAAVPLAGRLAVHAQVRGGGGGGLSVSQPLCPGPPLCGRGRGALRLL